MAIIRPLIVAALVLSTVGGAASAQVKPATSASPSFYAPQANPSGRGWYYPNQAGCPSVSPLDADEPRPCSEHRTRKPLG